MECTVWLGLRLPVMPGPDVSRKSILPKYAGSGQTLELLEFLKTSPVHDAGEPQAAHTSGQVNELAERLGDGEVLVRYVTLGPRHHRFVRLDFVLGFRDLVLDLFPGPLGAASTLSVAVVSVSRSTTRRTSRQLLLTLRILRWIHFPV